MPVATFDTLKFSKALREGGVPEKQADAEAAALAEVLSLNFRDVASKDDLKQLAENIEYKLRELEQRFNTRIDLLRSDVYAKFDQLRADMNARIEQQGIRHSADLTHLKWILGVLVTLCTGIFIRSFFFAGR